MKLQPVGGVGHQPPGNCRVSVRCPVCGQMGTLDEITNIQDGHFTINQRSYVTGQRLCPKRTCRAHLFFVYEASSGSVAALYPPELIDFDATNIPGSVAKAMEEAIACHSMECYIAAAIMVRKTLEELCHDRSATGGNLKERIRDLGTKIVLPAELLA